MCVDREESCLGCRKRRARDSCFRELGAAACARAVSVRAAVVVRRSERIRRPGVWCLTVRWCAWLQQRVAEPVKAKPAPPPQEEEDTLEDDEEEHGDTFCGSCGGSYTADEFWIGCDICEKWYHGKCVKITPARAEHIKQYKCPACSNKRART